MNRPNRDSIVALPLVIATNVSAAEAPGEHAVGRVARFARQASLEFVGSARLPSVAKELRSQSTGSATRLVGLPASLRQDQHQLAFPRRQPPTVLGILGYARAGKDSIAARLVERHGFVRYAFADALKAAALDLDPIVTLNLDPLVEDDIPHYGWRLSEVVARMGWEAAKAYPEVRRTLQHLGVAMRDHIGKSVWVDAVMSQVDRDHHPVVITDVRFPNEVAAIEARRGALVRVVRPGAEGDPHVSERGLAEAKVDYLVTNDSTLDELHASVDRIVAGL